MTYWLWVYVEKKHSNPVLYRTFLTQKEADDMFKGYYYYSKQPHSDYWKPLEREIIP